MKMPEEIAKIINKYGDYMGVLKNGTQEERFNNSRTRKSENVTLRTFKYLD